MLRRLVGTQLLDIMIVQFRNEKVSNHGSIPITIDCNVVTFIVLKKDSTSPAHQTVSFSGLGMVLDVVVVVSRTEHAVDEEDAAEIDKLSDAMGTVSIKELGG
ncbi:hypothetical protein TNCV_3150271 [Trichonephila clavipes]|nr:hypothetical protein TNCV_3150271 [Trichonephila clavipes]